MSVSITVVVKNIAQFKPTEEQRKWVDDECVKTNESQATVMRLLIQEKVHNDWLIEEVNKAYDKITSGTPKFIPHEEAKKIMSDLIKKTKGDSNG